MRPRPLLLWILCGLHASACASAPSPTPASAPPAQNLPAPPPLAEGQCLGNLVPPAQYLQETAFVPQDAPQAAETAGRKAQEALAERICQGYRCSEIAPHISVWRTASDAHQVCAMAVVKASAVEAFLEGPRQALERDLEERAREVAGFLAEAGHPRGRVAVDNVRDLGVDGGPRAEWLIDRMSAALSKTPVNLVRLPGGWNGLGLPRGVDGILRGRITRVQGREAMLEVAWSLEMATGLKSAPLMGFAEHIGPVIAPPSERPELADRSARVALHFEARPGGALCQGQRTHLRVATSEPLHVRVVNLYGEQEATLLWASPGAATGEQDLGAFVAVAAPDARPEQFWVVGAPQAGQLGPLQHAPAPCRLPTAFARRVHAGNPLDGALTPFSASRSFRVMQGGDCGPSPAMEGPSQGPEALPWCW